jgi:hypothetical protein
MTARGDMGLQAEQPEGGWSYLLSFFYSQYGDEKSRQAARRVLIEVRLIAGDPVGAGRGAPICA